MAETLLLADANPTMQRVVELTCAEHGLRVVSVSDGQQALDYLVAERPALALVSVTLQKMDGFEIAGFVRDRPDLQGIPVLLLAGAFETIDEARVRASGAAGVLIKPFEPGLVIKRVKELLGMSKPDGPPIPDSAPESWSGRMVTSVEAPGRGAAAPAPPAGEPVPSGAVGKDTADAWKGLRESSGLGADAAAVETSEGAEDYFGKLDAAFESLDAQLAARSVPVGRPTSAPVPPRIPAAIDPERRPTPPPLTTPSLDDRLRAHLEAPQPVSEVDRDWFGNRATSSVTREELTDFAGFDPEAIQTPRGAPGSPALQGTPAAYSAPETEAASGAIDWRALHDDGQGSSVASQDSAPAAVPDVTRDPQATYGGVPTPTSGFAAAEAFAMLWAHEQGEALPPVASPPPLELSEQSVDAVVQRMTDQLTARVTDNIASRVTDGLAARLTTEVSARVAEGLAEQIAAHVAERMMQQAFGEGLRRTVYDVSERLVREEIARIRAAATDSRRS